MEGLGSGPRDQDQDSLKYITGETPKRQGPVIREISPYSSHQRSELSNTILMRSENRDGKGVSSDLDGYRGALKREVFFHTFFCVLVRICNQTSSNQHLLVVGC